MHVWSLALLATLLATSVGSVRGDVVVVVDDARGPGRVEALRKAAVREKTVAVVEIRARWSACSMEVARSFSKPAIRAAMTSALHVIVDSTESDDIPTMNALGAHATGTVIVFDSAGQECARWQNVEVSKRLAAAIETCRDPASAG